jgi:hypothetical protein
MRSFLIGAGPAALVLATATVASAQAFPPIGPELAVSLPATDAAVNPAVSAIADRGYVVVWRAGTNILGRRFDAAGQAAGVEFTANVLPVSSAAPAVAARPDGSFLVVWQAPDGTGDGVFARRFDPAGVPMGGEIALSTTLAGSQSSARVAAGAHGYAVTCYSAITTVLLLLDRNAVPIRAITVPPPAGSADVAANETGFVVAVSNSTVVKAHLFDAAGNLRASTDVATILAKGGVPPPTLYRVYPRVTSAGDGTFTVSWSSYLVVYELPFPPTVHVYDYGTSVRRYGASGAALGPARRVHDSSAGIHDQGTLAAAPGGRLFATWASRPVAECGGCPPPAPEDGSGSGIYGRVFDPAGNDLSGELRVNTTTSGDQAFPAVAVAGEGGALVVWQDAPSRGIFGQRFGSYLAPVRFEVDSAASPTANGNGVLEPGERVGVAAAWRNQSGYPQPLTSHAVLGGGPGPFYETPDSFADFGIVANGSIGDCRDTGNCFVVGISGARPAPHWDAQFAEQVVPTNLLPWRVRTMHVGDSFADVPRSSPFVRFVETVFHNDVMTPCAPGNFCAALPVTREWMSVLVLRALDISLMPPACVAGSERFTDVPASNMFCPWIEELARRGVVGGCGTGLYCPLASVSRETMAVYLILTREGTGYRPPACTTPMFNDVPATSPFCRWIEELARRQIVGGCGGGAYCPAAPVSREQMSVFLTGTFGLLLYVP